MSLRRTIRWFGNLGRGPLPPVQRARRIGDNLWQRFSRRQGCCGRYGEPGC
ncbi:MAG TPA: hypothetical protein VK131_06950 [Candidatus Acidoferrales bacterium]|nr:hypothetical protein [Candidatus Acidoferrales bacterium]